MPKVQRSDRTCDRSAVQSLEIGFLAVLVTGCVHYFIMTSSHFDFLVPDAEFLLVMGAVLLILALSVVEFKDAFYAIHHLNTPHQKYAKPLSLAGIALGVVILPPALILLAILIEAQLLRFVQIKRLFEF